MATEISESKKIKLDHKVTDMFSEFQLVRVLSENPQQKSMFVHGRFGDSAEDAVLLMEKAPFCQENITDLLQNQTKMTTTMENDIYKALELFPQPCYNGIKLTLIHPATEKHLSKYSCHQAYMVQETPDDYENIVLPYIQSSAFSNQWVYNILEKKSEVERVIFEDSDPQFGFVFIPDMKWDGKRLEDLYVSAIVQDRSLLCLRSLKAEHLQLLENIRKKGLEMIKMKYGVESSCIRMYFHYLPTYYHLHVHFTHLNFDSASASAGKAVLLDDVIDNLRLVPDFYQRKTMSYVLRENDELLKRFQKAGRI